MEKPILFSTTMVQAIWDGRKTQTRRIVKPHRKAIIENMWIDKEDGQVVVVYNDNNHIGEKGYIKPPYAVGDILWVRETFYQYGEWFDVPATDEHGDVVYKRSFIPQNPNNHEIYYVNTLPSNIKVLKGYKSGRGYYKRPSLFMPRPAARIFPNAKKVRVERLQDISKEDARAEGIDIGSIDVEKYEKSAAYRILADNLSVAKFADLWNSLDEKSGYGWDSNPWVWVIEFEKV